MPDVASAGEITPVRSLYVDRPAKSVRAMLEHAGLECPSETLGVLSLNGDPLLVGIQTISPVKTALHVVIVGTPAIYAGARQKHYATWAANLRFSLEHAAEVA